ncbi:PREDICTED: receptor activity-modifying protein 1 [Bison bison bison]|uniref:Receptor activity-modifying protein 1 n=1 Tax=Bison bison bison TaxID=43346 RepID=A0A6P3JAG0_BISBB|nr:PREDICTED: receptor activity-modifying protein 1 [Bison bison bison]
MCLACRLSLSPHEWKGRNSSGDSLAAWFLADEHPDPENVSSALGGTARLAHTGGRAGASGWPGSQTGQSVLVGVGREGWSQPLTLQGWVSWADDCRAGALVAVTHLCLATACQHADHGTLLQESCLPQFQAHMEAVGRTLWCDWGKTIRSYRELSDCTRHVVQKLDCFWPNAEVDKFFLVVHQRYFRNCPVSGRALQDPPSSILCPFIVVPILVTLLVTVLVVWRSKRPGGIV